MFYRTILSILISALLHPCVTFCQQTYLGEDAELKDNLGRSLKNWDSTRIWKYANALKIKRGFEMGRPNTACSKKDVAPRFPEKEELNRYFELAVEHWTEQVYPCPELPGNQLSGMVGVVNGFQHQPELLPKVTLKNTIETLGDQQFSIEKAGPTSTNIPPFGAFGLPVFPIEDPCAQTGNLQRRLLILDREKPHFIQTYSSGRFQGIRFLVQDQDLESGHQDAPLLLHFHWATEIAATALQSGHDSLALEILNRAANWAKQQTPTVQISQNARMVWALCNLFEIKKEKEYATAIRKWINLGIKPFLILDENSDGREDETLVPLDSLFDFSKQPGRPFDAPSANLWNSSIVATALLKAYLAADLEGDSILKKTVGQLTFVVCHNVLNEANQGFLPENGSGFRDLAYLVSLLLNARQNLPPELYLKSQTAFSLIWGTGYLRSGGIYTAPLGLAQKALSAR